MIFNQERDYFSDVMTIKDFLQSVKCGAFIPDDGCGWLGNETHFNYGVDVWEWYFRGKEIPEGVTHVHWYNK
jgi:hypothetical protein